MALERLPCSLMVRCSREIRNLQENELNMDGPKLLLYGLELYDKAKKN